MRTHSELDRLMGHLLTEIKPGNKYILRQMKLTQEDVRNSINNRDHVCQPRFPEYTPTGFDLPFETTLR
jgi:hypothetical protein